MNDDFLTYAGKKSYSANHRRVYCLPKAGISDGIVRVTTGVCHKQELLDTAHNFDFLLTPRSDAPYNCGIVSYENQLTINFTRKCEKKELEPIFFQCLRAKGCSVRILSKKSD
ncbi:MAG: hypothetical protein PHS82_09290 [Lachnospiraceae bacterium]|nr:hypothetical protein [Lachnospiraceae bacterium]